MKSINIIGKSCFGCRACEQKCPKHCISMKENEEGFIYPVIDEEACIHCGLCLKSCPAYAVNDASEPLNVYAFRNKDDNRLKNSASGGVSDVIANYVIKKKGVVFGVVYSENLKPQHIRCETIEELDKIQSSKYVATDTNDTYTQVKQILDEGRLVLYTGSSCQIKGLLLFLQKDYDNLITLSLVCHGTPSYKLFRLYLDALEKKYKSKVVSYNFRDKSKTGWGLMAKVTFENGKTKYLSPEVDKYYVDFLAGNKNYRESCYECKFATPNRVGDIGIADYWGIEREHPDFYDKRGVSVIFVNTTKGEEIISELKDSINLLPSSLDKAIVNQGNMKNPTKRTSERDTFYQNIKLDDYIKYKPPFKKRVKHILKKCCPSFLKPMAKKLLRRK